jgi:hypothetical protein
MHINCHSRHAVTKTTLDLLWWQEMAMDAWNSSKSPPPVTPAALSALFIGSTRPALRTVPGNDCCSLGIGGSCAPNLRGSSVSCPIALIWLAGKRVLITREPPAAVKGRALGKQETSLETGSFNASCIVPLNE